MAGRYYEEWYAPSTPKKVKGGIKAQNKRGSFSRKWWGKRWIEVLESFNIGARLSRGKSYARKGQVISLDIEKGHVEAMVQGSRSGAYHVSLKFKTFTSAEWKGLVSSLAEQPIFAATLLTNEMPEDIESVFHGAGLSLFPKNKSDLETNCSCPDWSNPCKHIAAVYYLMAEAFDNDPFLIFRLRGMEKDKLLTMLQGVVPSESEVPAEEESIPDPLPKEPDLFWSGTLEEEKSSPPAAPPKIHAALPRRLGSLPFWRSEKTFFETTEDIYESASQMAAEWQEKAISQ